MRISALAALLFLAASHPAMAQGRPPIQAAAPSNKTIAKAAPPARVQAEKEQTARLDRAAAPALGQAPDSLKPDANPPVKKLRDLARIKVLERRIQSFTRNQQWEKGHYKNYWKKMIDQTQKEHDAVLKRIKADNYPR